MRCDSILFSVSEPTIHIIPLLDLIKKLKNESINIIIATNGYSSLKTLELLVPFVDGFRVDLKACDTKGYKHIINEKINFEHIKTVINYLNKRVRNLELTMCIIPDINDKDSSVLKLSTWIGKINKDIPFTLLRFIPTSYFYKKRMNEDKDLERLRDLLVQNDLKRVIIGGI